MQVRVLYSFPHPLGQPGIGTTALNQVKGLAGQGVEVRVYCPSCTTDPGPGVDVVEMMTVAGRRVPLRSIGAERAWRLHDRRVAHRVGLKGRGPDVVHTWPLGALATLRAARLAGFLSAREVPNTHTAHAYEEAAREAVLTSVGPERGDSHTSSTTRLAREEAEYEAAQTLLVPSDAVAESFLCRNVPETRLGRHQYGYDPQRFYPAAAPREGFSAIFVGRGEPRKGLHYALEAWRDSGAARLGSLTVYGALSSGYRDRVQALLDLPGVRVAGFSDDVPGAMRSADVLLLPSVEEGSALVGYEAQGSGCVLLASSAAGARIRHGEDGLVHAPRDVVTLASQLRAVATDPLLLGRLRSASIDAARDLTWTHAARRLIEVYEEGLKRQGP